MEALIARLNAAGVRYIALGGQAVAMPDLLRAKQAAGRPQDEVDIEFLQEKQRTSGG